MPRSRKARGREHLEVFTYPDGTQEIASAPTEQKERDRAYRIKEYWAKRGYNVLLWLVPIESKQLNTEGTGPRWWGWELRSDMVNGMPKGMACAPTA